MTAAVAYVEINAFAFVILILIYSNIRHLQEKYLLKQRIFLGLIVSVAFELVLDTLVWVLDGKSGIIVRNINLTATAIGCICSAIPFILSCLYFVLQIQTNGKIKRNMVIALLIPAALNAVLSILSVFNGYYFYFDKANLYHRGDMFIVMPAIWVVYLLFAVILLVKNRKTIQKRYFFPLIGFLVPPVVTGILQFSIYGLSIIWASFAISMQIVFMSIQNNQLYTDYLTGLFNRRQLDFYLDERVKNKKNDKMMAGIMVDLDAFKNINDKFGHVVGDSALIDAAQILRTSFWKMDLICRYGGDEFVIIIERDSRKEIIDNVNLLIRNAGRFNQKDKSPYTISFSIGYDVFDYQAESSSQQFINRIDSLMYANKKRSKS
ncbi:MAG: GGDEF domain-containing protein [Eubacteriales bacterium]